MLSTPNPRHERNRHHLVTLFVILVTLPLYLLVRPLVASVTWVLCVGFVAAILALRSVVIETSARRPVSPEMESREQRFREFLRSKFGVYFVEDHRSTIEAQKPDGSPTGLTNVVDKSAIGFQAIEN